LQQIVSSSSESEEPEAYERSSEESYEARRKNKIKGLKEIEQTGATDFKSEVIEFEYFNPTMKLFLQGLFKLKPYLMTSKSFANFRIVIELVRGEEHWSCMQGLSQLIDFLTENAAKVPVLIYAEPKLKNKYLVPNSPVDLERASPTLIKAQPDSEFDYELISIEALR